MAETAGPGGADRSSSALLNSFLLTFGGAVQQSLLYEPGHKVLEEPVRKLAAQLAEILRESPALTLQSRDQSVFVNEDRLRCDGPTFLRHQQFFKQFEARKSSGIAFHETIDEAQWGKLLRIIARADKSRPTVFEDIRAALLSANLQMAVDLLPPVSVSATGTGGNPAMVGAPASAGSVPTPGGEGSGGDPEKGGRTDRRVFAVRAFAKAVFLLREYLKQSPDSAKRGYYHLRLQRAIHDLIGVVEEGAWKRLGLVNAKSSEDYAYTHPVNVALLALVTGRRLGLKRPRLAELGMAAILHDVGKSQLPPGLMNKQGAFTEEERKQLASHPELGLRSLLRVRQYNEALLKRIVVLCEHHQAAGSASDHHPYSRMVAVACTFDALTSHRPFRAAYRPDAAMRILQKMSQTKLDRGMVLLFMQTLGLHPCGTLVELSDRSLAVTVEPNAEPAKWKSPTVRVVRLPDGMPYRNPPVVDLSADPVRTIVKSLDPAEAGINVGAALFEEPPKK